MQITRARNILMQQDQEWSKLIAEEAETESLIRYGFLFVILTNVASVLNHSYQGFGWFDYYLAKQIMTTATEIACLYLIPNAFATLAPGFGGENNQLKALKLYVFSMTPGWVGSLFLVIPILGVFIAIAGGAFSLYLLWKHVGEALSIPQEKHVQYVLTCVALILAAFVVTSVIGGTLAGMMFTAPAFGTTRF